MKTQTREGENGNADRLLRIILISLGIIIFCSNPSMGGDYSVTTPGSTGNLPGKTQTTSDPISAGGGEFRSAWPLLSLGGPIPVEFILTYVPDMQHRMPVNTGRHQFPPWGKTKGFQSNTILRMVETEDRTTLPHEDYVNVMLYDCTYVFESDGAGGFRPTGPTEFQIQKSGGYYYLMNPDGERLYIFRQSGSGIDWGAQYFNWTGEVAHIIDRNNNRLSFTYNSDNLPTNITDGLGRSLALSYISSTDKSERHIMEVADGYGRSVSFAYTPCSSGSDTVATLASFTDPSGEVTGFTYDGTGEDSCYLLTGITRPLGNSHIDQAWTTNPKGDYAIETQNDAYANMETLDYAQDSESNIITTVTHPDSTQRTFAHINERYPAQVTDEAGNSFTISYDSDYRPVTITDREGNTSTLTYHAASGRIASFTNAEGYTVMFRYTAQSQTFTNPDNAESVSFTFYNLTRIDYPDGTSDRFSYGPAGNLLAKVDRGGNTWTLTHNSRGQILTVTNPAGGTITYTYNADATLASRTPSGGGTTTYTYDTFKRLSTITHPDTTAVHLTYDLNDRVTSVVDETNHTYTYTYDANGNLTAVTDPDGYSVSYAYDLMDRVSSLTDRLGNTRSYAYDALGRLLTVTNQAHDTSAFGYSPQGWLVSVTDPGGKTRTKTYNAEGVIATLTDPLSNTWHYTTDTSGRITRITSPLLNYWEYSLDSMDRLTSSTDPVDRTVVYAYDSRGLLTGMTLSGGISSFYAWTDLGLLSSITDPGGNVWGRSYDTMGRLIASVDPLLNTTSYAYDSRDRLTTVTFPDGELQLTYDGSGNVLRRLYSDGTDLGYTYDANHRLLTANGLTLSYDAMGNIVACNGLVIARDDAGRMAGITFAAGKVVTYAYNSRGRVSRVTDWAGGSTGFTYDDAGRLTAVSRPNGVTTAYSYDREGRRVSSVEKNGDILARISLTRNGAGEITSVESSVPLVPEIEPVSWSLTYDAACQVAGYTYDPMGRLIQDAWRSYTWDQASRLTGYTATGAAVSFTYDAFSALLSRAEAGVTRRYTWNYALDIPSISVVSEGGSDRDYFVYTPEGILLYSISAADSSRHFYHYDEMGNTLFLTDDSCTLSDAYAYGPYGEALGMTGTTVNPFTWQGQYGVMHEPDQGMYYMRARWYDSNTARFISRDPIRSAHPNEINPYQYAAGNPLQYIDPSGMEKEKKTENPEEEFREKIADFLDFRSGPAPRGDIMSATSFGEKEKKFKPAETEHPYKKPFPRGPFIYDSKRASVFIHGGAKPDPGDNEKASLPDVTDPFPHLGGSGGPYKKDTGAWVGIMGRF